MTVGTPLPFEVEKKALRPSGSNSFFRGKAPSIVRPSYSVHSSIDNFQSWDRVQDRRPRRANPTLRASNDAEWRSGHAGALRGVRCEHYHYHSCCGAPNRPLLTALVHETSDFCSYVPGSRPRTEISRQSRIGHLRKNALIEA